MRFTLLALIWTLMLLPQAADARTWLVRQDGSGDCTTIQACCDSAGWGDTVLVAPGTYAEHVDMEEPLVLVSDEGPLATIIAAPSTFASVVIMRRPGVVDGFTIRDGHLSVGWTGVGGVYLLSGTLRNCLIVHNTASGIDTPEKAGGVFACGNAVIEGNTIVSNGYFVIAGGIYCRSDYVGQIVRNIVALNTDGYGIYCEPGATPTFICNNVWGNDEGEYAGACSDQTGLNGNISLDPLFCDPYLGDYWDFDDGDYTLHADSPCLAAPGCGLMGALGQGCPATSVEERSTSWGRIKVLFR